jgi:hypothetical protein
MKPKIILHCGAPKTGSTSFQHLLYANVDRLAEAGFYCPSVSRKKRLTDDIRILLGEALRPQNDNQMFLYRIRNVLEEIQASSGAHTLIISNESILGKPFSMRQSVFYPRVDELAARIRLALDEYEVEVRFVIRDYSGFLPSWYVQSVRMGSKLTFEEFLATYDFDEVDWNIPVQALRKHFGADNVGVFDHADLVKDSHAFLTAMFPDVMAALGERGLDLQHKNSSIGRNMVDVYRRWNAISQRIATNPSFYRTLHHLGRRYAILPFERFSKSDKLKLPPIMAAELTQRYQQHREMIKPQRLQSRETDAVRFAAQ